VEHWGENKRGKLSDDKKSREIRGVIDEGFPLLMREEAGVEDGRKVDDWRWREIRGDKFRMSSTKPES
jgi:hypothetical protein